MNNFYYYLYLKYLIEKIIKINLCYPDHSFARLTGRLGINVCVEFVIRHYANPPHPVARPNCSLERHNKRN